MNPIFNKKRRLLGIFLVLFSVLCLSPSVHAQQKVTASITVTNFTTNGMTFTLNGNTRTFTNSVMNPATQVLTNNDVTGCESKTNLLTQIYAAPFSQVLAVDISSNSFNLIGNANLAMSVTMATGLGTVSYATQTVSSVIALQGPVSSLPTANARTNVASDIVGGINAPENTNSISQISTAAGELIGLTNGQTIAGVKIFTNTLGQWFGIISNSPAISGTVIALTGGLYSAPIMASPSTTNLINYGSAISSRGTNGSGSEQFGNLAIANQDGATAIGSQSLATGESATAVGYQSHALLDGDTALGFSALAANGSGAAFGSGAIATNGSASAFGASSLAGAPQSTAIGSGATAIHSNSTAIGWNAATTAMNQVMLGSPGVGTFINNDLTVLGNFFVSGNVSVSGPQTNATFIGTNNFPANSDIAFTRKALSTLANGINQDIIVGTNVFIEVSGPTGAFSIEGVARGRDGKMIIVLNQTGQNMTIATEGGATGNDPTPENRIISLSGADRATTGNGSAMLIYSGAASRWILISFEP